MTVLRGIVIFALVLPASSGAAPRRNDVSRTLVQNLPKGWECLQGPNSFDHPGQVFYLDKQGVRFELSDVGDKINAQAGELATMSASSSGRVSAGLIAKILGIVGLSLNYSKSFATSVTLSQRQEFRTDEANTRAALRTLDPSLLSAENSYFVIRNTQVAKQMRLTVDRKIAGDFGGDIPFSNAVKVSGAAAPIPTPALAPAATSAAATASPSAAPAAGSGTTTGGATPVAATAAAAAPARPAATGSATVSLGAGGTPTATGTVTAGAAPKPAATSSAGAAPAAAPSASSGPPAIISAQDAKTYTIDQTFSTPLTVCFLAQKFTLTNVTGGVGGSVRVAKLEDTYWTPSRQSGTGSGK